MKQPHGDPKGYLVYTRLSVEEVERGGMSLDVQEQRCQDYAKAHGLRVIAVFRDNGYSGKSTQRPGFQELLKSLPEAHGLIVHKLDRLSRSTRDVLAFVECCQEQEKDLISVHEQFDTNTAIGRATLTIMAALAQMEREQVAERVRDGNLHRAKQGIWLRAAPFGYDYDKQTKKLLPNDRAQDLVRVFEAYCETGGNFSASGRLLNTQVVKSPTGKVWSAETVKMVINNPVYRGRSRYLDAEGKGKWKLVVPKTLLSRAEMLFTVSERMPRGRTKQAVHPLSGQLTCAQCGSPLIVRLRKKNGTVILRCRQASLGAGCDQPGISATRLEPMLLYGLEQAWAHEGFILSAEDIQHLGNGVHMSAQEVAHGVDRLKKKRERLLDAYQEGLLAKEDLKRRLQSIDTELNDLMTRNGHDTVPDALHHLLADGLSPVQAWPGMAPVERRQMLQAILSHPIEVQVKGEDRMPKLRVRTWLRAAEFEVTTSDSPGRFAYALRAPD